MLVFSLIVPHFDQRRVAMVANFMVCSSSNTQVPNINCMSVNAFPEIVNLSFFFLIAESQH